MPDGTTVPSENTDTSDTWNTIFNLPEADVQDDGTLGYGDATDDVRQEG